MYVSNSNQLSRELRENIIDCLNTDIISICETHLRNDEKLTISGYRWIGHNRKNISPTALRGSGGVGFLIKLSILDQFSVSILDSTTDDILWIKLIDKLDNENGLYLCSCYLPPSGSSRGTDHRDFTTY